MRTVLAVDTSSEHGSAALHTAAGAGFADEWTGTNSHSTRLVTRIEALLAQAGIGIAGIELLAGCVGPGSYTGLRVGLSAVTGLSIVATIPALGISCLQAIAWSVAPAAGPILAVRNGFRRDLFHQLFDAAGEPLGPPGLLPLDALGTLLLPADATIAGDCGEEAGERLREAFPVTPLDSRVRALAPAMAERAGARPFMEMAPLTPLYIRPVDIGVPRPR